MPYRIAYRIPDAPPRTAKDHPSFARLREQCPDSVDGCWVCFDHPDGGTLAVWPGSAADPVSPDDFGEPRSCADGLTFYPSREQPDLTNLLRSEVSRPPEGEWVHMSNGAEIWVAVASMSERRYALLATGAKRLLTATNAYGVLARDFESLCNQTDPKPPDDEVNAASIRLVVAAIHASYQITDDAIEDTEAFQLSHVDMCQVIYIARGLDPKGFAAALVSSRALSLAAESQTLTSDQPKPTPLPDGDLTLADARGSY